MQRYLLVFMLLCQCYVTSNLCAQQVIPKPSFKVIKPRVFDHAQMFNGSQQRALDSILTAWWEKEVADIVVLSIDDLHPDKASFDKYVLDNLTSYALGAYKLNNGIVVAISKRLGYVRIQNGYGKDRLLKDDVSKIIIDEKIMPEFRKGNYFLGILSGVTAIGETLQEEIEGQDYHNVSSIFRPQIFEGIREFVLEHGSPRTFRSFDGNNPSFKFPSLEVYLGPSLHNEFIIKNFIDQDFYEMTIRSNDGEIYQFVYTNKMKPDLPFVHHGMQQGEVYWWHPKGRLLSKDLGPLLWEMEDEIIDHGIANDFKPFYQYKWILKKEYAPVESRYVEVDGQDTVVFTKDALLVNGERVAIFEINTERRLLTLKVEREKQVSFAVFNIDGLFYYRYLFSKAERKLYLLPLDESEGSERISVEGRTLVLEVSDR